MSAKHALAGAPRARILMLFTLAIGTCSLTRAATYTWQVGYGNWSTVANWGGTEPTLGDWAYIQDHGTATVTQTGEACTRLFLGYNDTDQGTVQINGGDLTISDTAFVGLYGTGAFFHSGGTNSIGSNLLLGYYAGSGGSYDLSGDGHLSANSEDIALGGTGTFRQISGVNSIVSQLNLAMDAASVGNYYLVAGQLSALTENIGAYGAGVFTQSGGINTIHYNSYIGYNSGSRGTYSLDAGENTIASALYLGYYSDSIGTYGLGDKGHLSANSEYIGNSGEGAFLQGGGTNTVSNCAYLGYNSGSRGAYSLNGGTNAILSVLYVGYYSGSIGTYYLSGSGHLSADSEYIGRSGTGKFTQTGGTNTVASSLCLGDSSNSSGTYNLNGGTLILRALRQGGGAAVFNFGGGTLQASASFETLVPMTLTGIGGNATVDTAGYTVTLSGNLSDIGGLGKLGSGTLILNARNTYSGDTIVAGGTLEFHGGIAATGTSLIYVQAGTAAFKTTPINKTNLNVNTAASAIFEIIDSSHTVGAISGGGTTKLDAGASLTATSVSQGTITLGNGSTLTIRALTPNHSWDGGGADNLWTNKENWADDELPSPSDNITLPASGSKLLSVNDFAPERIFGSITVAGSGYDIQGNAIRASKITMQPDTFLQVSAISTNQLTLGAGSTLTIAAIPGGPSGSAIAPVPEPSALVLLLAAALIVAMCRRVKRAI
jgi:autotransporter-associated beta strand protein